MAQGFQLLSTILRTRSEAANRVRLQEGREAPQPHLQARARHDDALHIRRAVVRGAVGPTKTPESVASLLLVKPTKIPLALWREGRQPRGGLGVREQERRPGGHPRILKAPHQVETEAGSVEGTLFRAPRRGHVTSQDQIFSLISADSVGGYGGQGSFTA